ncbi:hypothetical protein FNF27_04042 [Cafeteria roenbergensis]|uniref:Uncharacterized protein n=1 Tax=Cafeteria roenbergensis TaxID=33653 RepID=A0A5A8EB43_CAFRO|nr:hypothetical protein FNF27_04042 [Cafeteria roenbergensis]
MWCLASTSAFGGGHLQLRQTRRVCCRPTSRRTGGWLVAPSCSNFPSTMAAAAGTAGEHRRGLDCLSEVLDDKHVAEVLREHLQFPHKASPALGYAGGSKFAAGALFVKLSTGPTSLFEGGPGLLGKVLAKEQAVGKFLLENLRSTNVVVPMSRRADVFVFDPGPMPIHWTSRDWVGRVVSARALVSTRYDLGDHSICVGSSDALQTFHLCAGFHPLAELIAATMGLSYGVVKLKGEGPVTLHKFETLVYKRDERLPKDAGMSDRDCALLLGMDKGESEVSKVCKELEQRYSVILDPLTQFRGRRVDDAMAVSRLPAPWATDPPGSIGSSLPFDVEMHVLPTGQACVVDVSRLAVPEARRAGPWITAVTLVGRRAGRAFAETARVASLDLSGAQGLSEFELSVDHPFFWLTSRAARPAALNAVSAALSGDHTTLAQRLRRAACEGAASVTVDASTGVVAVSCDESPGAGSDVMVALVSFPSLYWQSPQLSCLFGVEAGRFLKSRGLADLLFAQQHEGRMSGEARVLLSLQRMRHVSFSAELREIVRLRFVTLASILHAIGGQHAGTLSNPNLVDGVTCYEFRAEALGSTEEPTGPSPAPAPAPVPAAPAVERYTCLTTPANPGAVAAYSAAKSASEDS